MNRRLRSANVIAAAAALLLVSGFAWGLASFKPEIPHPPHATTVSAVGDFAVAVDHPHLTATVTPELSNKFSTGVLPRVPTALVALALVASAVAMAFVPAQALLGVMRGPPGVPLAFLDSRDRLTRFCIARR